MNLNSFKEIKRKWRTYKCDSSTCKEDKRLTWNLKLISITKCSLRNQSTFQKEPKKLLKSVSLHQIMPRSLLYDCEIIFCNNIIIFITNELVQMVKDLDPLSKWLEVWSTTHAYGKKNSVESGEPTLCVSQIPIRRFVTIKRHRKFRINNIIFSLLVYILNFLLQLYLIFTLFSNLLSEFLC